MNEKIKRVAVAISGGVDSSVAAALLVKQGYKVIGLFMKTFDDSVALKSTPTDACFGPNEAIDLEQASDLCKKLGIPFYPIDAREEYRRLVLDYFRNEYLRGRTPNPCIVCNNRIKFGFLLEKARSLGLEFQYVASGHYARIIKGNKRYLLARPKDRAKDQTYFLYALSQAQLSKLLFPLGSLTKPEVRNLAKEMGLETSQRAESQDFLSGGSYSALFDQSEITPGPIVDTEGRILGRHKGIIYYTVGQRKGLGIAVGKPLYVVRIDPDQNQVVVGQEDQLFASKALISKVNFISISELTRPMEVKVKIRYRHKEADATISPGPTRDQVILAFKQPQKAVTLGQSAVFYSQDLVVGGGIIELIYPKS